MGKLPEKVPGKSPVVAKPLSTAAAPNAPKVPALITLSDEDNLEQANLFIYGPPKHGKTFCAASISKHWPDKLPALKKTVLSDVLWLSADKGALDGMREQNVIVPEFNVHKLRGTEAAYKAAGLREPPNIIQLMTLFVKTATDLARAGELRAVVVDTVSAIDKALIEYYEENPIRANSGAIDKFAMYRHILLTHRKFRDALARLPVHVVFLAHAKQINEDTAKDSTIKRAGAGPGSYDIQPDITGQGAGEYYRNISLEAIMLATPSLREKGKFDRHLYTQTTQGFRAGNRWQLSLAAKEEANLTKLFEKVRAGKPAAHADDDE